MFSFAQVMHMCKIKQLQVSKQRCSLKVIFFYLPLLFVFFSAPTNATQGQFKLGLMTKAWENFSSLLGPSPFGNASVKKDNKNENKTQPSLEGEVLSPLGLELILFETFQAKVPIFKGLIQEVSIISLSNASFRPTQIRL